MPDGDGYPTEEELCLLKSYCGVDNKNIVNIVSLLGLLACIWWPFEGDTVTGDNTMELHTGGWSGNEEIIDIMEGGSFWLRYCKKSKRGGHYWFEWPAL